MILRDYQQAAFDAAVEFMSKCVDTCLIEAATGAGKSHIVAALADWINEQSGKKVLCIAPSKELTEQNYSKFLMTGKPASFFSASLGKSLSNNVVFGTPVSILNSIEKFGANFAAVIIDECHGITPTIKKIIDSIRAKNNRLRIVGLTATPYRLGSGYIFQHWPDGKKEESKDPYFHNLVYRVTAQELIDRGFLTPPDNGEHESGYTTKALELNRLGKFDQKEVEQTFEGKGRLTSKIVREVVALSADKMGVIFFAATIKHAEEIIESLPANKSRIVTGKTKSKERDSIVKDFKLMRFKYLVNVSVLTTGFDAPHVDVIAILRATESAGLLQQIVGRGLRLHENKDQCLILDYAENLDRHCPDGDIFNPLISPILKGAKSAKIKACCALCGYENEFSARINKEGFDVDEHGYFVDLSGKKIKTDKGEFLPGHHGRRCENEEIIRGHHVRCEGRWSHKVCPACAQENDITARHCSSCKHELIDPNDKLTLNDKPADVDKVISWRVQPWISHAGNKTVRIDFTTDSKSFPVWFNPKMRRQWDMLTYCTVGKIGLSVDDYVALNPKRPETITAKKGGKYYRVYDFNKGVAV